MVDGIKLLENIQNLLIFVILQMCSGNLGFVALQAYDAWLVPLWSLIHVVSPSSIVATQTN